MSVGLTPREKLALWLAKAARCTLRLLGRGGTNFPGELAVKIAPDLLGKLARGVDIAAVSGTNGKTTCCRVLAQAYADAGTPCLANRSGANLLAGITAEFAAAARLSGKPKYRKAVIECDEAAAKTVFRLLQPHVILYTNVFRDQLDRYGEVTHTLENLRFAASQAPGAVLCLNADDSLLASLADALPNKTRFYGVDAALPGAETADELSDARFCIRCRTPYEYDRRTYAHLGAYRCPQCGYRRPEPDVAVTAASPDAEGSDLTLRIGDTEISARFPLPAAYNIYNAAASAAALPQALGRFLLYEHSTSGPTCQVGAAVSVQNCRISFVQFGWSAQSSGRWPASRKGRSSPGCRPSRPSWPRGTARLCSSCRSVTSASASVHSASSSGVGVRHSRASCCITPQAMGTSSVRNR